MKTTIELPDVLFREAKKYAAKNGVPLRAIVESGVRIVIEGGPRPRKNFRLKTITTKGEGLACEDNWSTIRSLAYEGHGG